MKVIFALATLVSCIIAQSETNSQPFRLFLKATNATLDNKGTCSFNHSHMNVLNQVTALGTCHEGAALEGMCVTGETPDTAPTLSTTFYQAITASSTPRDDYGILFWNLTLSGNFSVPSAMEFSIDATSNAAMPIFFPNNSSSTAVSFKESGNMYIARNVDDTVSPPASLNTTQALENWYICLTRWSYLYQTLVWKIGVEGVPQNPSCQKVAVQRVFN